eukprot:scaffold35619_cov25-Prasinocladus_malaysianus.AAC.1
MIRSIHPHRWAGLQSAVAIRRRRWQRTVIIAWRMHVDTIQPATGCSSMHTHTEYPLDDASDIVTARRAVAGLNRKDVPSTSRIAMARIPNNDREVYILAVTAR